MSEEKQEITGTRPCDGLRVDLKRCLLLVIQQIDIERQIDTRQTDSWTDRHQTGRKTDRWTDRQKDRRTEGQIYKYRQK